MRTALPTVCVPDPRRARASSRFTTRTICNGGGPHGAARTRSPTSTAARWTASSRRRRQRGARDAQTIPNDPICSQRCDEARRDGLPRRRATSRTTGRTRASFVLQDHMFEPNASWSLPAHLFMVSEWSAHARTPTIRRAASNALQSPGAPPDSRKQSRPTPPIYAWTDLTYLLHKHRVSWRYYVFSGTEPDCEDDAMICDAGQAEARRRRASGTRCPYFDTVHSRRPDSATSQSCPNFFKAAKDGHAARGVVDRARPARSASIRPALVSAGQAYVTSLVNAVDARPRLEVDRDLPRLGRLGRLLRPRRAADGRRERLRPARPGTRHQPLRAGRATSTTRP